MLQFTKRHRMWTAILALCLTFCLALPLAAAYPKHTDYISDESGVLSTTTKDALKDINTTLYATRGARIGICVVDSTGDEEIASYARNLFIDWNMSDGVLLVIDRGNKNYFAVQSVDVDDVITDDILKDILSGYLEEDFDEGNTDRGVLKTILKLDEYMTANLPATGATVGTETGTDASAGTDNDSDKQTSGFVHAIGVFFKIILWLIILAAVAVGGLFVAALFNDTALEIFRTYILRKPTPHRYSTGDAYDERLYGQPQQRQPSHRQNGGGRRESYYDYDEYGQPYPQQSYRQNGYPTNNRQNGSYPQQRSANGQYTRQNGQYPQNHAYRRNEPYEDPYDSYQPQGPYNQNRNAQNQTRRRQNYDPYR